MREVTGFYYRLSLDQDLCGRGGLNHSRGIWAFTKAQVCDAPGSLEPPR